jgi:uncharacterized protein (TIGR04255 family)
VTSELWRFTDLNDAWSVGVAADFISLETSQYTRFEEFFQKLETLIDTLLELEVPVRERVGLRYTNEINHPDATLPADWQRLINEELLGMVGGEELGDDVLHTLQDIRLRERDGTIALRHGFLSSEVAPNGRPTYLIDLDYYDDQARQLDRTQTLGQIGTYHEVLKNIFETSITEELRAHLVVREEID